ncbi:MAG: DNA mismatch repair protein MutS [Nitrospinae bacterium]|nr:DNA mismatch repair protein MutS [Nitrospinota bacterium]
MSTVSTPMMAQYWALKREHPDAILFFRMGDFYEMFGDDAVVAAKAMNIALTTRDKGSDNPMPMCGVPYHALDTYLPRMIRQGRKVAICEQVEDPKTAKGVVRREVIRVVTPGTVTDPALLDATAFNFLAAVAPSKRGFGLAVADLSTGLFRVCEFIGDGALEELELELDRARPKQILVPDNLDDQHPPLSRALAENWGKETDRIEGWNFGRDIAEQTLREQFGVTSLDGFGLQGMELATGAAGAAVAYLRDTQKGALGQITRITLHNPWDSMPLDAATRRNLELTGNLIDGGRDGSLLSVLDQTMTPMGARVMREWITRPLLRVEGIRDRQEVIRRFVEEAPLLASIRETLDGMGDLERAATRVAGRAPSPRDLAAMRHALSLLPRLRELAAQVTTGIGRVWQSVWDDMQDVRDLLERAVSDEPPAFARDGGMIRAGFNAELDELKAIRANSHEALLALERDERARSGIATLKVKYNKVFGYFMEVTRKASGQAPLEWTRKQSLVNAERYISPALKDLEDKILNAEERAITLELELYEQVRAQVAAQAHRAQSMASVIGEMDALAGLAWLAREGRYVQPEVDEGDLIEIEGGRHPVLERLNLGERFVPNDAALDRAGRMVSIITGPNMAGKSTYIRQVAVITLMAQMGSHVPAARARIGLADRIFTRVGAQDHLQRGQSTFMVEMNETALILNNATARSLIILDEIGRGTSTFDGISIAWAVAERIHHTGSRTLFATHYHELTELADTLPGVRNLTVAVKEWNEEIVFLRKIVEGAADKSYGIQVARLAGLPREVIARAGEILTQLETNEVDSSGHPKLKAKEAESRRDAQTDLFARGPSKVEEALRKLDVETLTPLEALNKLAELKKKV